MQQSALLVCIASILGCQPRWEPVAPVSSDARCIELAYDAGGQVWSLPEGVVLDVGPDSGRAVAVVSLDSDPVERSWPEGVWRQRGDTLKMTFPGGTKVLRLVVYKVSEMQWTGAAAMTLDIGLFVEHSAVTGHSRPCDSRSRAS